MQKSLLMILVGIGLVATSKAEEPFVDVIGPVTPTVYTKSDPVEVPYIFWGGDVVTWYANGGQITTPSSIYGKMGLKIKLVPGDNFQKQIENLLAGKTPFLRADLYALAFADEAINKFPETQQSVVLQLSWSTGDYLIGREQIRTVKDLKGKKVVLQRYGPHVNVLDRILQSVELDWKDVAVVWARDPRGTANSPYSLFLEDETIDAAFTFSPDMISLSGGIDLIGTGAEGTIKGAHVLARTERMDYLRADVYSVSNNFLQKNSEFVSRFIAGYLEASKEISTLRIAYKENKKSPEGLKYTEEVLRLAQNIWGRKALPTLEVDVVGFMDDVVLVDLEGNTAFFNQKDNEYGYVAKLVQAEALAIKLGYIADVTKFFNYMFDYEVIAKRQQMTDGLLVWSELSENKSLADQTIFFSPNKSEFDSSAYVDDFDLALRSLSLYDDATLVIRGHSDPSQAMYEMVMAGKEKGLIQEQNAQSKREYVLKDGSTLDSNSTENVLKLIENGEFGSSKHNPRRVVQEAYELSVDRAEAVRKAILAYAKKNNIDVNPNRIKIQGMGVTTPIVLKPSTPEDACRNMRVDLSIVKPGS